MKYFVDERLAFKVLCDSKQALKLLLQMKAVDSLNDYYIRVSFSLSFRNVW